MRHNKKGTILDRKKAARNMMLRNLAASIIIYEKVKTTQAKAKAVRPLLEQLITLAKQGNLTSQRQLRGILPQKMAIKKLTEVLVKRYQDKSSGYLRITKLNRRSGDGAEQAIIALI